MVLVAYETAVRAFPWRAESLSVFPQKTFNKRGFEQIEYPPEI